MEPIIFKNICREATLFIDEYKKTGGYIAIEKAFKMSPELIIDEVKKGVLRGRGGAGFPAGIKWSFMPKESKLPKYLCVNADEAEPGTFKDRQIMEKDPHLLIEGIIIASFAMRINTAYIYIRGEYSWIAEILEKAINEAYQHNLLGKNILGTSFSLDVYVHRGAGAYICGEETALMESIEGKRGLPRVKPPFPAQKGLFGCPTTINNVETISVIPYIITNGGEKFLSLGIPKDGGTRLYSVSGHIKKPGVYELPSGITLKEIIYTHCGGIRNDNKLKAVIPGGASSDILAAHEIDIPMSVDGVMAAGSMLGSSAIIVMDETTCMVNAALILARFFYDESCGQCTPCREGTGWLEDVLHRIEHGEGKLSDLDILTKIPSHIAGHTLCAFGDALVAPVRSTLNKFRLEYEEHITTKRCPLTKH